MVRCIFILLFIASAFFSPAIGLLAGIIFALIFTHPYLQYAKKLSKYILQIAVVGLGFGINLFNSIEAGTEGILLTIISVFGVMIVGHYIGKWLKIPTKLSYLISSGTAICGGSAIAAISPVVKANENETTMSLAIIFILNAIALFTFPVIGDALNLTQQQFGLWAAIAIHDTSSVVGAGTIYGPEALATATTVKLTRALWIIPLSLVSMTLFRGGDHKKIAIPWFIFLFIGAVVINTYLAIPSVLLDAISTISRKLLSITLFLIGSSLSISAIKTVGLKPVLLGVSLWLIITIATLLMLL
jgi:Predicted membrane protein